MAWSTDGTLRTERVSSGIDWIFFTMGGYSYRLVTIERFRQVGLSAAGKDTLVLTLTALMAAQGPLEAGTHYSDVEAEPHPGGQWHVRWVVQTKGAWTQYPEE